MTDGYKPRRPAAEDLGPASVVQDTPEYGSGPELYQLVLRDIVERSQFGARKYGRPLTVSARIDFLTNAYQELLDLLIYFRGEIQKRDEDTAKAAFAEAPMRVEVSNVAPRSLEERLGDLEHINEQLRDKLKRAGLWDDPE